MKSIDSFEIGLTDSFDAERDGLFEPALAIRRTLWSEAQSRGETELAAIGRLRIAISLYMQGRAQEALAEVGAVHDELLKCRERQPRAWGDYMRLRALTSEVATASTADSDDLANYRIALQFYCRAAGQASPADVVRVAASILSHGNFDDSIAEVEGIWRQVHIHVGKLQATRDIRDGLNLLAQMAGLLCLRGAVDSALAVKVVEETSRLMRAYVLRAPSTPDACFSGQAQWPLHSIVSDTATLRTYGEVLAAAACVPATPAGNRAWMRVNAVLALSRARATDAVSRVLLQVGDTPVESDFDLLEEWLHALGSARRRDAGAVSRQVVEQIRPWLLRLVPGELPPAEAARIEAQLADLGADGVPAVDLQAAWPAHASGRRTKLPKNTRWH